jgi:hypothetical protein
MASKHEPKRLQVQVLAKCRNPKYDGIQVYTPLASFTIVHPQDGSQSWNKYAIQRYALETARIWSVQNPLIEVEGLGKGPNDVSLYSGHEDGYKRNNELLDRSLTPISLEETRIAAYLN